MVDVGARSPAPARSFFGIGGEERFRSAIARVTAGAGSSPTWLEGLREPLRQLLPYDCVVIAVWRPGEQRYTPVLEDGDTEALRTYLATEDAAAELRRLGFFRLAWPMVVHRVGVTLAATSAWRDHLWPAGFRDGLGVGLFTEDGRHVGFLSILTYRAHLVPATAAGLLHAVNPLLGSALDLSTRREDDRRELPEG
jgi:hypothetical protein